MDKSIRQDAASWFDAIARANGASLESVYPRDASPARRGRRQMVFLGNPEYGCDLQPIDFAAFARACGGVGFTVDDADRCGRAVEEFLAAPGPAILEAIVDPFELPLPGKVTVEQSAKFAQSLLRGEPNREKIAWTVLGDRVREMV